MKGKEALYWLILFANTLGAAWGFVFFYGDQFASTPFYLWPFIPDCPLATALFAGSLLLLKFAWDSRNTPLASFYTFISFAGALKYGFWTVFVLVSFSPAYLAAQTALLYFLLILAHIGLFLEAFFLLPGLLRMRWWFLPLALAYFLANDYSDYFLGTHPPLPQESLSFMLPATVFMSLAFVLASFVFLKSQKKPLLDLLVLKTAGR